MLVERISLGLRFQWLGSCDRRAGEREHGQDKLTVSNGSLEYQQAGPKKLISTAMMKRAVGVFRSSVRGFKMLRCLALAGRARRLGYEKFRNPKDLIFMNETN